LWITVPTNNTSTYPFNFLSFPSTCPLSTLPGTNVNTWNIHFLLTFLFKNIHFFSLLKYAGDNCQPEKRFILYNSNHILIDLVTDSLQYHGWDQKLHLITITAHFHWVLIFIQTQFWKGLSLRRSNSKQSLPYPWYGGESDIVARIHHHYYYYYDQNYYVISLCFESLYKTQTTHPFKHSNVSNPNKSGLSLPGMFAIIWTGSMIYKTKRLV